MSETCVFYLETKSIMEVVIQTTVDVAGKSKDEKESKEPDTRREVSGRVLLLLLMRPLIPIRTGQLSLSQ